MTTPYTPPEDAFDQWLDALVDEEDRQLDDDRAEVAAFLQRHFALSPADGSVSEPGEHAASPSHVGKRPTPITGSPKRAGIVPMGGAGAGWHVASLLSAAVLVLIAIGMIGALLRMGDDDHHGGVSATASMLPFAPSPALASPTPAATCATDDTLLLTTTEPVGAGAFADLPFPVAWLADGTLTVARAGEVLRELEIGDFSIVRPTLVPDVIHAFDTRSDGGSDRAAFANIATGETIEIGSYQRIIFSDGPYAFWVSDDAHTHWHAIDLRSFETADLNEQFDIVPLRAWTPYVSPLMSSDDGTVMLVGTTIHDIVDRAAPRATPVVSDGPEVRIGHDAMLINGGLDAVSVIGPLTATSGDMTISPDGRRAAWLAPSDTTGMRTLTVQDVASGEVLAERPIDATYSNSLLFSADGLSLYATHGATLDEIKVRPTGSTPAATPSIELPDNGYRIVGASPDRAHVLLDRPGSGASETSLWIDLATGDLRELEGAPGRLWTSIFPLNVAPSIADHILLDDLQSEVNLLDMNTGEIVTTVDRDVGAGAMTISADQDTVLIPRETKLDLLDLSTGMTTSYPIPDEADESVAPLPFSLASEGSCLAGTWWLDEGADTVLLSASDERSTSLPPSFVKGWVPSDAQNP